MKILNKNGEKMPPSFTPLSETKLSENAPFQMTQSDNLEY